MPKKNLLISAALTAFVLVMLTGVASAYKEITANFVLSQVSEQVEPTIVPIATLPMEAVVVVPTIVNPNVKTTK